MYVEADLKMKERAPKSLRPPRSAAVRASVRRVYIPKGKDQRAIGVSAFIERVVQAALKLVIEPIFEHEST